MLTPYWFFLVPYLGIAAFFWVVDTKTIFRECRTRYCEINVLYAQYNTIWPLVGFNLFVIKPILIHYCTQLLTIYTTDFSFLELCKHILFFILCFEIAFYFTHRILHIRRLYKHIHYVHHQMRHTLALGGVYAHPIEFIIGNFLPPAVGPLLLGNFHYITLCSWSILVACYVSISHSGYGGIHIEHHWSYQNIFGITGVIDVLLGTDRVNKE